jgi:hypothetical protein
MGAFGGKCCTDSPGIQNHKVVLAPKTWSVREKKGTKFTGWLHRRLCRERYMLQWGGRALLLWILSLVPCGADVTITQPDSCTDWKIPCFWPEILESGDPCWLLKLRWTGTQRLQMKGVLSWLLCWAFRDGTIGFCSALAALVGSVQKNFFSHRTLFQILCPHRPTIWAGILAGSPICKYVSLVLPAPADPKKIMFCRPLQCSVSHCLSCHILVVNCFVLFLYIFCCS